MTKNITLETKEKKQTINQEELYYNRLYVFYLSDLEGICFLNCVMLSVLQHFVSIMSP